MRRAFALLLVAGLACGVLSTRAAGDGLDELMRTLAARHHGEVDFIEQHFLALLSRPSESSGVLIYDAPDRLEKRTLEPRAESLLLSGNSVTVQRGTHRRTVDLQAHPQILPFVESIRATLAGDRDALERIFRVEYSGSAARWMLILEPRAAEVGKMVRQVRIDGSGAVLRHVEIFEADGDRSLMTLRERAAP